MSDNPSSDNRLLHTMIRVRDLERSLAFYCEKLGMQKQRALHFDEGRFSLVYLGYGSDREHAVLELTHNWDDDEDYTHGSGYGHIGVGVAQLQSFCDRLSDQGVKILRPAGEMMNTGINIAFIEDPDGYKIELIELPFPPEGMGAEVTY